MRTADHDLAWLMVLTLIAVGACAPAPSRISDPREILARALGRLDAARTVHVDVTVDGTLALGSMLPIPGGGGGSVGLAGTHAAADVDLAGDRAAARFEVPALLGLTGELRQIGSQAYLTSSLTSSGWHRVDPATLPLGLARPIGWLDALAAWMARPTVVPTRLDDATCRAGTCYVVRVNVASGDLDGLGSAAPSFGPGLQGVTLTLALKVDQASFALSDADIGIDLGAAGSLDAAVVFTRWDAAVSVEPPPASDIVEGPLLP